MPVLNEGSYVANAVRTVLDQDWAGPKELILALGPSTDDTDAVVAELAARDDRIIVVRNPAIDIPVGLNLAIRSSCGWTRTPSWGANTPPGRSTTWSAPEPPTSAG
jgi:glycosyltransferase involved in cell wall biosynthesis